jgi:hypothetical protein
MTSSSSSRWVSYKDFTYENMVCAGMLLYSGYLGIFWNLYRDLTWFNPSKIVMFYWNILGWINNLIFGMWVCQWVDFSIKFWSTRFSDAKCLICLVINQISQINKTQEWAAVANIDIDWKSGKKTDVCPFLFSQPIWVPNVWNPHGDIWIHVVEPLGRTVTWPKTESCHKPHRGILEEQFQGGLDVYYVSSVWFVIINTYKYYIMWHITNGILRKCELCGILRKWNTTNEEFHSQRKATKVIAAKKKNNVMKILPANSEGCWLFIFCHFFVIFLSFVFFIFLSFLFCGVIFLSFFVIFCHLLSHLFVIC